MSRRANVWPLGALVAVVALAGCDPIWGVHAQLRDPASRPIADATLAVACGPGNAQRDVWVDHSRHDGAADVGSIGAAFPPGCDVYVAKPGYETIRIPYRTLCAGDASHCERVFALDLVLRPTSAAPPPASW